MIDASNYLIYLREQQTLICRSCEYCLQPNGIEKHLQRTHSVIPLKIRRELVSYAESLILRNPFEVITSFTVIPIFDCLKMTPGFRCLMYNSLYGTLGSIKKHCKGHRWMKPEGMSRNSIV